MPSEATPHTPAHKRGTANDEKPFAWQAKAALRRIREAFDKLTFLDQAIAVYVTLTEFASDEHAATFTRRRREIAERSGVSLRRVQTILNIFKDIGAVTWKQNQGADGTQELAPSTYTLCSVCPTSRTDNPTLCKTPLRQNCTVDKQSPKESPERLNDAGNGFLGNEKKVADLTVHRLSALEKQLMGRLRDLLGEDEMARAGGHWRADWVRPHANLVDSALKELDCQIKEGHDKENRAAWLEDLLKRWKKSKTKTAV
jgi:hypothetical protein